MVAISVASVPVSEAASRLGVSEQRVRAMISAGAIDAEKVAGAWWIPAQSLARALTTDRRGGRPFSLSGAWVLLLVGSGESAAWASSKVRSRASAMLGAQGLAAAFGKLDNRAVRHALVAHPAELSRLAHGRELMLGGVSAAAEYRLGLQGGREVEAYVRTGAVERVVDRHGLDRDGETNVILRAVPDELWPVLRRPIAPLGAVLADLSEHSDSRARRVARDRAHRLDRDRGVHA